MGVLCVEHANVLKLCYIELLSGDSSFRLCSLVWWEFFYQKLHKMPSGVKVTAYLLEGRDIAVPKLCPFYAYACASERSVA